jgi:hypothetical protein
LIGNLQKNEREVLMVQTQQSLLDKADDVPLPTKEDEQQTHWLIACAVVFLLGIFLGCLFHDSLLRTTPSHAVWKDETEQQDMNQAPPNMPR